MMSDAEAFTRRRLDEKDLSDWGSLVRETTLATPFHTAAWLETIATNFDYDTNYLVWEHEDEIVAGVPLFDVGGLVGRTLVNPFCEYSFPLLKEPASTRRVARDLVNSRYSRQTMHLKEGDWTRNVGYHGAGFGALGTGTVRRLDVRADSSELRNTVFDRSIRKNLKTAEEQGISITTCDEHRRSMDVFYELHLQTVRRKGSPQFPRRFFATLLSTFGDKASLYLANRGEEPVASLLTLDHDRFRHLYTNASDPDHWDARPNDALYARAVLDASESPTIDIVDFGRSEAGSGVDRFKERFGGSSFPLTTLVSPPHKTRTADVGGLRRLEPLTKRLAPVITHPAVGPRLKELIHE